MSETTGVDQAQQTRGQTYTIIAAAVLLACLIAAGVLLTTTAHMEPGAAIGFLTGVAGVGASLVALLGHVTSLRAETQQQTSTLLKIDHQTNGGLTARIRADARDVAREEVDKALNAPIPYLPTSPATYLLAPGAVV